jgi:hypothetical protein
MIRASMDAKERVADSLGGDGNVFRDDVIMARLSSFYRPISKLLPHPRPAFALTTRSQHLTLHFAAYILRLPKVTL